MFTKLISPFQVVCKSNPYAAHLKLTQCCMPVITQEKWKGKKYKRGYKSNYNWNKIKCILNGFRRNVNWYNMSGKLY